MGKSVTQKRRREAEAEQERRLDASGIELPTTTDVITDTTAVGADAAAVRPSKKARTEDRRSIFVRSLPPSATSEKLTEFFSEHFPVKHATVVTDPKTKASRGYGFVTFTDAEDAREAKAKLDNQLLDGRRLRLDIAEPRSRPTAASSSKDLTKVSAAAEKKKQREAELLEARKAPKLIIRNLPWSIKTSQDLAKLFTMYGKVKFADLPSSKGKMAGFGFVTLRGKKNAENAIQGINGKVVDGRTLAVDFAVDKQKWEEMQQEEGEGEEEGGEEEEADDKKTSKAAKSPKAKDKDATPKTAEQLQAEEDMRNFMANNMDNLEEEDDDKEEEEEEEEEEDEEDEDEDDEDKEWEDDDEDDEDIDNDDDNEEQKPAKPLLTDNSATIFVRNLPFTTTDDELKAHFAKFGPLRYARTVRDRATDRPAGTGFVCFVSGDDAKACLRAAPRVQKQQQPIATVANKHSVLQDERVDRDGRYTLGGRVLQLAQAVSKAEATQLFEEGPAAQRARDKDKRRLFLLSEGTIAAGSPLYQLLPPNEIQMREKSAKQRQTMVKSNPALHLSLTRLAVRNLPKHIDSKGLKELARRAIVGFATDVKQGLRAPLSKEELARGGQQDREAEQLRRAKGKGVVRQAKIVFETDKGSKVDEAAGGGKSRGYGFIEFWSHRWALTGLRWLNGYAVKHEHGNKTNRLIVEFAIENANVVARRKMLEERSRQPRPAPGSKPEGPEGEAGEGREGRKGPAGDRRNGKDRKDRKAGGRRPRDDKKDSRSGKGSLDPKAAKAKDKAAEPKSAKKEKADAKLVARSQIIQRKRMLRKKKSGR